MLQGRALLSTHCAGRSGPLTRTGGPGQEVPDRRSRAGGPGQEVPVRRSRSGGPGQVVPDGLVWDTDSRAPTALAAFQVAAKRRGSGAALRRRSAGATSAPQGIEEFDAGVDTGDGVILGDFQAGIISGRGVAVGDRFSSERTAP